MNISLTPAAARRIQDQIAQRGRGLGLRVGVKSSGCHGYSYVLDYADEITSGDQVFEVHGAKLVVDTESIAFMEGATLDFVREGLNQRFRVLNPKAKDLCGCGESFSLA